MTAYQTILVTSDLSDGSLPALEHAALLGRQFNAEVILLYCAEDTLPPIMLGVSADQRSEILSQHRRTAQERLVEFAGESLQGCQSQVIVVGGGANACIVDYAKARKVDLIIIASQGKGFLGHSAIGSTTHRLLNHAPCPVLVVPSVHR
ncbi:MAG: universal stress protein [Deltaproteobacteria bacterium]|nr:universal stress protein [Deltaproteobacteria bacterium]